MNSVVRKVVERLAFLYISQLIDIIQQNNISLDQIIPAIGKEQVRAYLDNEFKRRENERLTKYYHQHKTEIKAKRKVKYQEKKNNNQISVH